jgi:membrane-associated protease RseP (regulator of RpoE activity)
MEICEWGCLIEHYVALSESEFYFVGLFFFIALPMCSTVCHEAGHYYAAMLCGVGCEEFKLGIGPLLIKHKVNSSGCQLAIGLFPFGGRVTYDDRYYQLTHAKRAFLSAAGWLVDVIVAAIVLSIAYRLQVIGPAATIVCGLVSVRVIVNLTPLTGDGRNTFRHLWISLTKTV